MQKQRHPLSDVSDSDVWRFSDLRINDDGMIEGSAYTRETEGGYDITVSVTSYEYERHGETRVNHVPNVVVSKPNGGIAAEPHAHDSRSAVTALKNAKNAAEYAFNHIEQYVK